MIVYSTGSGQRPTVRLYSLTTVGDVDSLPAVRYSAAPLHVQAHRYAVLAASEAVDHAPHYSVVDCHSDGAAVYSQPRYTLAPALTDWQSEVLQAVRMLRRWRYYSESPAD